MATDIEKLKEMAEDTIYHKKMVLDNCLLLSEYLINRGKIQLGTELLKRGCEHDNSKFDPEEFRKLSQILKSRKCFTNASELLSQDERKAIEYHWKHNRHHPEFFENPSEDMEEIDILEMVCDWYARSLQYKTDFIPFIMERQENRFHFSVKKFEKILKYCKLIKELHTKSIDNQNG